VELSAPPILGSSVTLEVTTPILWDPLVIRATIAWRGPSRPGTARAGMRFSLDRGTALRNLIELLGTERFD
jgi:hypothetical protein